RRRLPESRRFIRAKADRALDRRWHTILRPPHRRWLGLVILTGLLLELTNLAVVFALDFLQTQRHLSASTANFLLVAAGLPGIATMILVGSLSDRLGRRRVGCSFGAASLVGAAVFFWAPGGIPVLLPALTLVLVGQLGAWPTLSAYSVELFPT